MRVGPAAGAFARVFDALCLARNIPDRAPAQSGITRHSQEMEIERGLASLVFFSVNVSTPSSSCAVILSRSTLLPSVNERRKCPTLYSVWRGSRPLYFLKSI